MRKNFKKFTVLCFAATCLFAARFAGAATPEFQSAAQVLAAARAGNVQQVQALVAAGANVNYIDNTGLSIVCTALMNNDVRAAQILQVYGADASRCDQQIRRYNQRQPRGESGGLFSGLSTAQNMVLAVGAAGAVIGAVWLLSDVFAPKRPLGGSGGGGGGGTNPPTPPTPGGNANVWVFSNTPCGPNNFCSRNPVTGLITEDRNAFESAMDFWATSPNGTIREDFALLSDALIDPARAATPAGEEVMPMQNYLLLMNGYAAWARGYLGMTTLRTPGAPYSPLPVAGTLSPNGFPVGGGAPVVVALISENGVNTLATSPLAAVPSPTGGGSSIEDGWLYWANQTGNESWAASLFSMSRRFYNNRFERNNTSTLADMDASLEEDTRFNLSNDTVNDTAIENPNATEYDNILAKIIIGGSANGSSPADPGRETEDYTGFLPNGQLIIYRTGGTNGGTTDYQNYAAMLSALNLAQSLNLDTSPANGLVPTGYVNVIANAAPIHSMYAQNAWTISDYMPVINNTGLTLTQAQSVFVSLINNCYGGDCRAANANTDVGFDADDFFWMMAGGTTPTSPRLAYRPLVIFSTGGYLIGSYDDLTNGAVIPGAVLEANIENAAPLAYVGLEHYFMSVVAVQLNGAGTGSATDITGWNQGSQKIVLSTWADPYDTGVNPDIYGARKCGWAGLGANGIDPWCFAAAGQTDMMAVASMAGAVGAMQSAFGSYMTNDQIFFLMALTSDSRQLVAKVNGQLDYTALQNKYELPPEIQLLVDNNVMDYRDAFADVFGYGLINLSLATQPGAYIYYFGPETAAPSVNSPDGNSIWSPIAAPGITPLATGGANPVRNAVMLSGAFGARGSSINIPMFDFIESADGELSMPRIFDGSVPLSSGRHGMHMGDILGDFKTDKSETQNESGGVHIGMSFRETARDDGFGNLDKLSVGFDSGRARFGAAFERNAGTTNILRGDDANPIMALSSNMTSATASYRVGNWRVGARAGIGAVTEEGLLSHDPMLSGNTELLKLGDVSAFESGVEYKSGAVSMAANVGTFNESDTLLGAYSDGLVAMNGGKTVYMDNVFEYRAGRELKFNARYTTARTTTGAAGATIIAGLSDLYSDAMSVGAEYGGWSFALSRPLAVTNGSMKYVTADVELVESDTGFDLSANPYVENLNLSPDVRETRASLAYRAKLGEFTNGAIGFVYRNNPNHTNEFGNETLLMLKLNHRIGI
ncbi:MAG: ankyrin repeat domain-containing protein [Alphaproteobacteria bacterium]|nr:ankyrin repeat domain-containing protein [Alphaproteobacteria bacterium]